MRLLRHGWVIVRSSERPSLYVCHHERSLAHACAKRSRRPPHFAVVFFVCHPERAQRVEGPAVRIAKPQPPEPFSPSPPALLPLFRRVPPLPHPLDQQLRPHAQLRIPHAQPRPMPPMLEQVYLRRHARLHQRLIEHHAVHHRHRTVVGRRKQKHRRRLRRHMQLRRHRIHLRLRRRIAQQILPRSRDARTAPPS